jgi:hypothetical protein
VNEQVEIMFKTKLIIYNLRNCAIVICDTFVGLLVCWDDVIISKAPKTKCGHILSRFTVFIL